MGTTPWLLNGRRIGYTRGGTYYLRRALHGRYIRASTGCVTEVAALAEYRKFEADPLAYVSPLGRRAFAAPGKTGKPSMARHERAAVLRQQRLGSRYKITVAEYDRRYAAQGGLCLVCGCPAEDAPRKTLEVDHCHRTGTVRGLLCGMCNRGIGHMRDSADLLRQAADYLERGGAAGTQSAAG